MQKAKPSFKSIINKKLKVNRILSDGEIILGESNLFKSFDCFLNFNEDFIQFEYKVDRFYWVNLSGISQSVCYYKINATTYEKSRLNLPIIRDDSEPGPNFTTVKVDADFKGNLLNLFSPHRKEFVFVINYTIDFSTHQTIFYVQIPEIPQKKWYSATNLDRAEEYLPAQTGGEFLLKLFKKDFCLPQNAPREETALLGELKNYAHSSTCNKFKNTDFLQMFKKMLVILDLADYKKMEEYNLPSMRVINLNIASNNLLIDIENRLRELMCPMKISSLLEKTFILEFTKKLPFDTQVFDHIHLTEKMSALNQHSTYPHEITGQTIKGKISHIFACNHRNIILFEIPTQKDQSSFIHLKKLYDVQFEPNRIATRVGHQAIDAAVRNQLAKYLITFNSKVQIDSMKTFNRDFIYMNPSVASNKEQKSAVENIFNRTSFPSPYIVFGPPGTGKTTTIVEAIAQIVKSKPNSRILVTAGSNSACDDIGKRLLKYVSINKILRLNSPSFEKNLGKVDKILEPISNFRNRRICDCKKPSCPSNESRDDPTYEEFYTSRVIIATLVSCGRIVSGGCKTNHFDYIFIDEAASECEQHTLIPIAGLGSGPNGVTAQIVLSGDHKQLGPKISAKFCCEMGMEKSMMERIMETNVNYQRGASFNSKYVTQLVKNYRSHPAILQFSNNNFYDSKLQYKCPKMIADFACGWDFLKNKKFPLLFHTICEPSRPVGLSLKNDEEIITMKGYIHALVDFGFKVQKVNQSDIGVKRQKVNQSDIGIISPYRAQCEEISKKIRAKYPNVEVGTVDSFQGREKKIIIMSTVRSGTSHVGFLYNEKRLNVALTRAKCLLIIIGNSATLQKCVIWNKFMAHCKENDAIVGDPSSINQNIIDNKDYEGSEVRIEGVEDEYDVV